MSVHLSTRSFLDFFSARFFALLWLLGFSSQVYATAGCESDLLRLDTFIRHNDAGAPDHLQQKGELFFNDWLAQHKLKAQQTRSPEACAALLKAYLKGWRATHLELVEVDGEKINGADAKATSSKRLKAQPRVYSLSASTLVIELPNFRLPYAEAISELIKSRSKALKSHRNWIIDVRGNTGGSELSYYPLLAYMLNNKSLLFEIEWRVTAANIRAQQTVCELYAQGEACLEIVKAMRQTEPGSYMVQPGLARLNLVPLAQAAEIQPSQVAILMDGLCASACEQFVWTARQSYRVKVFGRPSLGALDYANIRPIDLGRFRLFYALSRSFSSQLMPIDKRGLYPDIYLAESLAGDSELNGMQSWLESEWR